MNANKLFLLSISFLTTSALGMAPEKRLTQNKPVKSLVDFSLSAINSKTLNDASVEEIAKLMYQLPHLFEKIDLENLIPVEKRKEWKTFIREQLGAIKNEFDQETFEFLKMAVSKIAPEPEFIKGLAELGPLSRDLAEQFREDLQRSTNNNPLILYHFFDELFPASMLNHDNRKLFKIVYYDDCLSSGIDKNLLNSDSLEALVCCASIHDIGVKPKPAYYSPFHGPMLSELEHNQIRIRSLEQLINITHGLFLGVKMFSSEKSSFHDIYQKLKEYHFCSRVIVIAEKCLEDIQMEKKRDRDNKELQKSEQLCLELLRTYSEDNVRTYFEFNDDEQPTKDVNKN